MNALRRVSALAPRVAARAQYVQPTLGSTAVRAFAGSGAAVPEASKVSGLPAAHELGSVDNGFFADRVDKVKEPERRAFTYFMLSGVRFAYASAARLLVIKLVSSMSASAEVLALAFSEFDLSQLEVGKAVTVKWRGKPIFIRKRSQEEIEREAAVPMEYLRDPETDEERAIKAEYIIVIGICPHLGCVPLCDQGEFNGWFCPCHGSHYDLSGRIRKGPAPLNLEVPPYKYIQDELILMG
ncbi:Rieske-1, mitochondrial [Seminavis robusta]|uniref:Cytochrome b-c1 complex subunit Rieske, mitochondrial n=1 Tax=Seminavis robusta TaxID=568900 RepID=A0A9N8EEJ9_9STRA|nr:Rieske-1, mitochondrial [Seminavis robusta]|eukprot:Sro878_g214780.1 Rieske-1, mitochondrial (240) ;mRNA; r:32893-33917